MTTARKRAIVNTWNRIARNGEYDVHIFDDGEKRLTIFFTPFMVVFYKGDFLPDLRVNKNAFFERYTPIRFKYDTPVTLPSFTEIKTYIKQVGIKADGRKLLEFVNLYRLDNGQVVNVQYLYLVLELMRGKITAMTDSRTYTKNLSTIFLEDEMGTTALLLPVRPKSDTSIFTNELLRDYTPVQVSYLPVGTDFRYRNCEGGIVLDNKMDKFGNVECEYWYNGGGAIMKRSIPYNEIVYIRNEDANTMNIRKEA